MQPFKPLKRTFGSRMTISHNLSHRPAALEHARCPPCVAAGRAHSLPPEIPSPKQRSSVEQQDDGHGRLAATVRSGPGDDVDADLVPPLAAKLNKVYRLIRMKQLQHRQRLKTQDTTSAGVAAGALGQYALTPNAQYTHAAGTESDAAAASPLAGSSLDQPVPPPSSTPLQQQDRLPSSRLVLDEEMTSERAHLNPVYRVIRTAELRASLDQAGRWPPRRHSNKHTRGPAESPQPASAIRHGAAPGHAVMARGRQQAAADHDGSLEQRGAQSPSRSPAFSDACQDSLGVTSRARSPSVIHADDMVSDQSAMNPVYRMIRKVELQHRLRSRLVSRQSDGSGTPVPGDGLAAPPMGGTCSAILHTAPLGKVVSSQVDGIVHADEHSVGQPSTTAGQVSRSDELHSSDLDSNGSAASHSSSAPGAERPDPLAQMSVAMASSAARSVSRAIRRAEIHVQYRRRLQQQQQQQQQQAGSLGGSSSDFMTWPAAATTQPRSQLGSFFTSMDNELLGDPDAVPGGEAAGVWRRKAAATSRVCRPGHSACVPAGPTEAGPAAGPSQHGMAASASARATAVVAEPRGWSTPPGPANGGRPTLLASIADDQTMQLFDRLSAAQVSPHLAAALCRATLLQDKDPEMLATRLVSLAKVLGGVSVNQAASSVIKAPNLLNRFAPTLSSNLGYLTTSLGLESRHQAIAMVLRYPQLLEMLPKTVSQHFAQLQQLLRLSPACVCELVMRAPFVLGLSPALIRDKLIQLDCLLAGHVKDDQAPRLRWQAIGNGVLTGDSSEGLQAQTERSVWSSVGEVQRDDTSADSPEGRPSSAADTCALPCASLTRATPLLVANPSLLALSSSSLAAKWSQLSVLCMVGAPQLRQQLEHLPPSSLGRVLSASPRVLERLRYVVDTDAPLTRASGRGAISVCTLLAKSEDAFVARYPGYREWRRHQDVASLTANTI